MGESTQRFLSTWVTRGTEVKSGMIMQNCFLQTVHVTKAIEASDEQSHKILQEKVLALVVQRTQKQGFMKPTDCFLKIFRVMCFHEVGVIDPHKVRENQPLLGVFLVQEVKRLLT